MSDFETPNAQENPKNLVFGSGEETPKRFTKIWKNLKLVEMGKSLLCGSIQGGEIWYIYELKHAKRGMCFSEIERERRMWFL